MKEELCLFMMNGMSVGEGGLYFMMNGMRVGVFCFCYE